MRISTLNNAWRGKHGVNIFLRSIVMENGPSHGNSAWGTGKNSYVGQCQLHHSPRSSGDP